jgi:hypothetical protein
MINIFKRAGRGGDHYGDEDPGTPYNPNERTQIGPSNRDVDLQIVPATYDIPSKGRYTPEMDSIIDSLDDEIAPPTGNDTPEFPHSPFAPGHA